jgi:hypothetical protein
MRDAPPPMSIVIVAVAATSLSLRIAGLPTFQTISDYLCYEPYSSYRVKDKA